MSGTADPIDAMSRAELVFYLAEHVYGTQPERYHAAVRAALAEQTTEALRGMARQTRDRELEQQERRAQARAARRAEDEQCYGHTARR